MRILSLRESVTMRNTRNIFKLSIHTHLNMPIGYQKYRKESDKIGRRQRERNNYRIVNNSNKGELKGIPITISEIITTMPSKVRKGSEAYRLNP